MHYAWGSRSFIQELVGRSDPLPLAELWFGTHPRGTTRIVPSGRSLRDQLAERSIELPYLVKILAADEPLSIQCHPDAEQARQGFQKENEAGIDLSAPERIYRDENPKPELLVALTPFAVLKGFRSLDDMSSLLAELAPTTWDGLAKAGHTSDIQSLFAALARLDRVSIDDTRLEQAEAAGRLEAIWLRRVRELYPADSMIVAPLLLQVSELVPGEAVFLPAREPHAYLRGAGVEVMANSDNVLRCGLTPKHVDVDELLRIMRFEPTNAGPVATQAVDDATSYVCPNPFFAVRRFHVRQSEFRGATESPTDMLLCTHGLLQLACDDTTIEVAQGGAALLPPGAPYRVTGSGDGFLVTQGR